MASFGAHREHFKLRVSARGAVLNKLADRRSLSSLPSPLSWARRQRVRGTATLRSPKRVDKSTSSSASNSAAGNSSTASTSSPASTSSSSDLSLEADPAQNDEAFTLAWRRHPDRFRIRGHLAGGHAADGEARRVEHRRCPGQQPHGCLNQVCFALAAYLIREATTKAGIKELTKELTAFLEKARHWPLAAALATREVRSLYKPDKYFNADETKAKLFEFLQREGIGDVLLACCFEAGPDGRRTRYRDLCKPADVVLVDSRPRRRRSPPRLSSRRRSS